MVGVSNAERIFIQLLFLEQVTSMPILIPKINIAIQIGNSRGFDIFFLNRFIAFLF